jgi:fatty-acid desaturase
MGAGFPAVYDFRTSKTTLGTAPARLNEEQHATSRDRRALGFLERPSPRMQSAALRAKRTISWANFLPIILIHVLAFLVFVPWLFSWAGLAALIIGIPVFGTLGITLCYHRLLTHRSFKTPRWVERTLVVLALCSLEGPPGTWVATHRWHHAHSDEDDDVHSPLVSFLWSHVGWMVLRDPAERSLGAYAKYAYDILSDPFYMKLEKRFLWFKIYLVHALMFFTAGPLVAIIARLLTGAWTVDGLQLGLSLLVWGVLARTVLVWHVTWSINSLTHMFGYRSYDTHDHSRNNWLVAVLSSGEGWHNNHHADPASASNRHRWWEFDPTYAVIRVMAFCGLASDIKKPRHARMADAKHAAAKSAVSRPVAATLSEVGQDQGAAPLISELAEVGSLSR